MFGPEGLSVVSFDDTAAAKYASPKLTSVRQPSYEKGYRAAQILVDQIREPYTEPVSEILQGILIIRESCTKPPKSTVI